MLLWLNKILTDESIRTDYGFMLDTLSETLNDDGKVKVLIEKYFTNTKAIKNVNILLESD